MSGLADTVRAFRGRRVLVVGDVVLDVFECGRTLRLASEAPAPVVTGVSTTTAPGGAANVAANLATLGARVTMLSVVGEDEPGAELLKTLEGFGVETQAVIRDRMRGTAVKRRLVSDGVILARVDEGDASPVAPSVERELSERARVLADWSGAVVVSDYLGGVVAQSLADALCGHPCVVLDAKDLRRLVWRRLAAVTPNHLEAQGALGTTPEPDPGRLDAEELARGVLGLVGTHAVALTLAEAGALVATEDGATRVGCCPVPNPDVNGAGDTFLAAFALALAGGAGYERATRVGVEAAALAVAQVGTVAVNYRDLLQRLPSRPPSGEEDLEAVLELARAEGACVVFTNGCFDLLHRGHLAMLEQAKALGDVLVVGVNSDASVSRIKGPGRPVMPECDRVELIRGLSCVDHVVVFDEDTAERLIRRVKPDVYVKGGDYADDDLAEKAVVREFGGEVIILPLLPGRSASSMIEQIRRGVNRPEAGRVASPPNR